VSVASSKAKLAGLVAHRDPADPAIEAARAHLREATAAARVREIVAAAPPLSAETRAELAIILLSPDSDGDA
jgi:CBS-domain-containing membrane protein